MATQTKSVFLYGKPTTVKRNELIIMQEMYTKLINSFIEKLVSDKKYWLDILNNNKKAPQIRELEKANRTKLGSAFGQNAIDHAVKELHNHFIRIRNDLYGKTIGSDKNYFVASIALLNACIQDFSVNDTEILIKNFIDNTKKDDVDKLAFYNEILDILKKHSEDEIQDMMLDVKILFLEELESRNIPTLKKAPLQLDSRLCTLGKATNIKADYVLSIKTLERGKRIEIPLSTSKNSIRRLNQYGMQSPTITVTEKGIMVAVPFKKKVKNKSSNKNLKGIDIGITDLIYSSDGLAYGNYSKVTNFYNAKVLPEDRKNNQLRSLMKKYQKELRDKNTHPKRKEFLRKKVCNINTMLQQNKKANRIRQSYKHLQNTEISKAASDYFLSIEGTNATTVMEDLDIITFDRGKESNRRNSMWARGQLHKKIESLLLWNGYKVIKVDPAYTSKLCPVCNNIHNDNRHGKDFTCTCCGYTADADYNASINIKNRAFDKEVSLIVEEYRYNTKKRHTALKELYEKRNKEYKTTVV